LTLLGVELQGRDSRRAEFWVRVELCRVIEKKETEEAFRADERV
jgi:hypothetical protein